LEQWNLTAGFLELVEGLFGSRRRKEKNKQKERGLMNEARKVTNFVL